MSLIQFKRADASFWTSNNPALAAGEPGWERDTNRIKIGRGPSVFWNDLPYFNGTGSGLVIFNPGNNRMFVSDGTNVNIKAQSNLLYSDNDDIPRHPDTQDSFWRPYFSTLNMICDNNDRIPVIVGRVYSNDNPLLDNGSGNDTARFMIDAERYRGSAESPLGLKANDVIFGIRGRGLRSDGKVSNASAITIVADTDSGPGSTQNRVPGRITISTVSSKDVVNNHNLTLNSRGQLSTNADVIISPAGGRKTGIYFNDNPHAFQVFNGPTLNTDEATRAAIFWNFGRVNTNDNPKYTAGSLGSVSYGILSAAGDLSSSAVAVTGTACGAYRNTNVGNLPDDGVVNFIVGSDIQYGHAATGSGNGVTNLARGLNIQAWAGGGDILTAYDIYLAPTNKQEGIGDGEGNVEIITGNGTINRFGIVQASPDPNVLSGSLTVNNGLSSPTKIHDLGFASVGNIDIDYDINKQIQKISLVGDFPNGFLNFNLGINWPATDSVDVFMEMTVINTMGSPGGTQINWPIVNDWYNGQPPTLFPPGKYLFLFRSMGASSIQGHYLGSNSVSS